MERELRLNINSDQIRKGLKTVGAGLKKLQKTGTSAAKAIGKAFKTMAKTISIGVGAAAVGLAVLVKVTLDAIDRIGKLSTQTGIATETLGVFKFAADLAGTSLDVVAKSAVDLGKKIEEFVTRNSGEAKTAFEQLGISAEELTPIMNDSEAQMKLIADRFEGMEDGATKAAIATRLYGEAGVALIPLLNEGAAGFEKLRAEAERYGLILSETTVRGVEAANDAFTRLKARIKGLITQTVGALAPAIEAAFNEMGAAADAYIKKQGGVKNVAAEVAVAMLRAFKAIVMVMGELVNVVNSVSEAMQKMTGAVNGVKISTQADIDLIGKQIRLKKEYISVLKQERIELTDPRIFETATGFTGAMVKAIKALRPASKAMGELVSETAVEERALRRLNQELIEAKENLTDLGGFTVDTTSTEAFIDNLIAKVGTLSQMGGDGGFEAFGKLPNDGEKVPNNVNDETLKSTQASLDSYTQSLLTEEERLFESYDRRQLMVQDAFAFGLIAEESQNSLLLGLTEDFENAKTEMARRGARDRMMVNAALVGNTASMLGSISQLMTANSKKQSWAAKALAKASIIANTAAGIMKSHAQVPWPGNWAEAGAIALAGAASLRQLNLGGSIATGSAGVAPGDVASPPPVSTPTAVDDRRGELTVILDGNFYGWDDKVIDDLIVGIASAVDDRDVRLISPTSRNAQDLAEAV